LLSIPQSPMLLVTPTTEEKNMSTPDLKEELSDLAKEVQELTQAPSRLHATLWALRLLRDLHTVSSGPKGASSNAHRVIEVAQEMGGLGFTLDELIEVIGPEVVFYPRRYKNKLSGLLREAGFHRNQVRRNGKRPLVWFTPAP